MKPEERLQELGLEVPDIEKLYTTVAAGVHMASHRQVGNLLFLSGIVAVANDKPFNPGVLGKDLTIEQGYEAARMAALCALSQIKYAMGDLDAVEQFVQMIGYIACTPDFRGFSKVLNGASDLFTEVFGERGAHTRAAVGVTAMAGGSSVEIVVTVQVRGDSIRPIVIDS